MVRASCTWAHRRDQAIYAADTKSGYNSRESLKFALEKDRICDLYPRSQISTAMKKRPLSVTIIGWLFIVVGAIGFLYHSNELRSPSRFGSYLIWVCLLRLIAIVSGAFLLRGSNWARWVLLIWIAYHVGLGVLHSWSDVLIHSLILIVIAFFLLRPQASGYFLQHAR